MTRLSYIGVAAVATAVLLSGCVMEVDYAKKLEGTWVSHRVDRDIGLNPDMPEEFTSVTTTVTAVIEDGDGLNSGEFTLTVSNMVPGTDQAVAGLSISGSFKVNAEGDHGHHQERESSCWRCWNSARRSHSIRPDVWRYPVECRRRSVSHSAGADVRRTVVRKAVGPG